MESNIEGKDQMITSGGDIDLQACLLAYCIGQRPEWAARNFGKMLWIQLNSTLLEFADYQLSNSF